MLRAGVRWATRPVGAIVLVFALTACGAGPTVATSASPGANGGGEPPQPPAAQKGARPEVCQSSQHGLQCVPSDPELGAGVR